MKRSSMSSKKQSLGRKTGDKVERLGEKVVRAGAPKTGRAVYNAGSKIARDKA